MRIGLLKYVFIGLCIMAALTMSAQLRSTLVPDTDSLKIGEVLNATIRINKPSHIEIEGIDLSPIFNPQNPYNPFTKNDSLDQNDNSDIDIISLGDWENNYDQKKVTNSHLNWINDENDGSHFVENRIQIIFWDPGMYFFEGVNFVLRDSNDANMVLRLQPTRIMVMPPEMLMDTTQKQLELRPMKYILTEQRNWTDYNIYYIIFAILIFIGIVTYYLDRNLKRKKKIALEVPEIIIPPHEIALDKLDVLKRKALWQKGEIKEYQSELTYIIREYLENQYHVSALEMTTEEIVKELRQNSFDHQQEGMLRTILTMADLIKFAKAAPPIDIHQQFMETAEQFVMDTKIDNLKIEEEE